MFEFVLTYHMIFVPFLMAIIVISIFNRYIFSSLGTKRMLRYQYRLNPLKVNSDNEQKLSLLIHKAKNGLLRIEKNKTNMIFYDKNTDGTEFETAKLWIGTKYFAYGILTHYGSSMVAQEPFKPSFDMMTKLIELEEGSYNNVKEETEIVLE